MSATRDNPFPGMNPYMEERWHDVHPTLLIHLRSRIQTQLPNDLLAVVEGKIIVDVAEDKAHEYRADVGVWTFGEGGNVGAVVADVSTLTKPLVVRVPALPQRWVEVRDTNGQVVTAIEVLSPSNKRGRGAIDYRVKRDDFMAADVNLVEIDVVRSGGLITELMDEERVGSEMRHATGSLPAHIISVHRAAKPEQRELYPVLYQNPLPVFAIPLRRGERDVVLDLQSVTQQCFTEGGFWRTDYRKEPQPPLAPEDSLWLDDLLKSKGLR